MAEVSPARLPELDSSGGLAYGSGSPLTPAPSPPGVEVRMRSSSYTRLSAQDYSFLVFETPTVHMHVAATQIFEAGPLRTPDGGIDIQAFKRAIAGILHLVPRYRQRLEWIPLENHPVWVDD